MGNFVLTSTAQDEYATETFDADGDLWSETDNTKTTASRKTTDSERDSVMQFLGDSWQLDGGQTLGDGNFLGDSDEGKGEGVYEDYTVTAGNIYAFSVLYKCDHGAAFMTIEVYDQTNVVLLNSTDVNDTNWNSHEERITAPVGCTTIRVKFLQKSTLAFSGPFYIDNVALNESAIIFDPEEYTRTPQVIGSFLQTLGGRRIRDQRCVHYELRLWWEFMEKGAFDLLYSMLVGGGTLYLDDGEVPNLTEDETVYETTTEDYVSITNPSSTNKAYTDNSASLPSAEDDFDSTEYSTVGYQKIDALDANYHETTNPTAGRYLYHRFDIDPDIDSGDAQRFRVLVRASGDDASPDNADGCILYVWDDTDSTWVELAQSSSSAITNLIYSTAESDVAQRYLDSSDQRVKLLLRTVAPRATGKDLKLRTYYVEVEINEGLDLTVDLSHTAILDDDSDVIHVKNTTQGTLLKNLIEYDISADRQSIAVGATYATLNGSAHRFNGGNVLNAGVADLSISGWVKMDGNPGLNSVIVQKFAAGAGYSFYINTSGVLTSGITDSGGTVTGDDGTDITDNVWHHVAVTFDRDGNMTRYLDGAVYGTVDDISSISGNADNALDFMVGCNSAGTVFFFEGSIRDVRILMSGLWSAPNIATQVLNPEDDTVGGSNTSSWYFNDAAGDTDITDNSASNDLTLEGGTTTTFDTHTRDLAIDSGDSVEVKYNRYWEVAFSGLPEDLLNGSPSEDRAREVEVVLETLSETPLG